MNCITTQNELVNFHWSTLTTPILREVEQHLAACPECLAAYWDLKRAIHAAEVNFALPSETTRLALQESFAATFPHENAPLRRRWVLVGAAAAVIVAALGLWWPHNEWHERPEQASPVVDSANPTAQNIHTL